jgi:hypothetical protein
MNNDYYEYRISDCYLSALFNADFSGLNDEEIEMFENWEKKLPLNGCFSIPEEEPHFAMCEITGLMSNVVDLIYTII